MPAFGCVTARVIKEYIESGPGDFIFVPAHFDHMEGNPYGEPAEAVLSRGPDNIVINLDE